MAGGTRNAGRSEDENMERLINKVCTRFVTQLEEKLDERMNKLDVKISQVCDSLKNLSSSVRDNTAAIKNLQDRYDYLEQDHKRNSIRVSGLQQEDDENLPMLVSAFITNKLNIPCSPHDINYVFRLGKVQGGVPRAVIVNFISYLKKAEVIACKKVLKGSKISIYEDLTRSRYDMLVKAKNKYGKNKAWSTGGKIFYWDAKENKKVMFENLSDL